MAKKTIMVVDDEPHTLVLTKAVLEGAGFKAVTFEDPHKALKSLRTKKPDLLILDVRMPGMSGPEFCEQVRNDVSIKSLKIAFFTASSDMDKQLLKKHQVLGFIFKPFDNNDLIKQIKSYL